MNIDTVLAFTLICFFLVISPGPNVVLFLKTVPAYGKKSGLFNLFGILSATYVHGALSFFGLSAIVLSSATLFIIIKVLGAFYLAFLGIKSLHLAIKSKKADQVKGAMTNNIRIKKRTIFAALLEGFLTQLLNPKVSIFYLAAFPQLIDFQTATVLDVSLLVFIHTSITFLWFIPFIYLLGKSTEIFHSNVLQRFVQSLTGIVFLFFSYKILTVESKN